MGKDDMKNIAINLLLVVLLGIAFAGCDNTGTAVAPKTNQSSAKKTTTPTTTNPTTTPSSPAPAPAVNGLDQLNISNARMLRFGNPANARITRKLYAVSKQGDSVSLSFEKLNWPTQGSSKKVDGHVYLFWKDGSTVLGGQFDFHGVGQTSKGLVNVYGGILGGKQPPRGARIYICLVSFNGQRTNVAESQTRW